MGDRYILTVICPKCRKVDDNVYFAPTCGFTKWTCENCGYCIDLYEYTGISYEEASNAAEIAEIVSQEMMKETMDIEDVDEEAEADEIDGLNHP